MIFKNVWEP